MRWLVAIVSSIFLLPVLAADIYVEKRIEVHIDGEIRTGDAERVASLISGMKRVVSFDVKSPGGNVEEALRISSLIDVTNARFYIKKGELCMSACFFMFIAGKHRYATPFFGEEGQSPTSEERARGHGYVGIHRPHLASKQETKAVSADKQEALMQVSREYLRKRQVPQYLVDEMMGRASNQIYWLREKDLDLLGDYSSGYEEVLIKECGYNKVAEFKSWTKTRRDDFNKCSFDVWEWEYFPLQGRYIERLSTGWRPWVKR